MLSEIMEYRLRHLVTLLPLLSICMLVFSVRLSNEIAIAPSTLGGAIINAGKFTNSLKVSGYINGLLVIMHKDKKLEFVNCRHSTVDHTNYFLFFFSIEIQFIVKLTT